MSLKQKMKNNAAISELYYKTREMYGRIWSFAAPKKRIEILYKQKFGGGLI